MEGLVGLEGLQDWNDFWVLGGSFWYHLEGFRHPGRPLWHHFGGQGVQGDTQEGTLGSNDRFFMIFDGFGGSPWRWFLVIF